VIVAQDLSSGAALEPPYCFALSLSSWDRGGRGPHCRHLRLVGDVAGDANCGAALEDKLFGLFRAKIAVDVG
jgi:hypothetical protein